MTNPTKIALIAGEKVSMNTTALEDADGVTTLATLRVGHVKVQAGYRKTPSSLKQWGWLTITVDEDLELFRRTA